MSCCTGLVAAKVAEAGGRGWAKRGMAGGGLSWQLGLEQAWPQGWGVPQNWLQGGHAPQWHLHNHSKRGSDMECATHDKQAVVKHVPGVSCLSAPVQRSCLGMSASSRYWAQLTAVWRYSLGL